MREWIVETAFSVYGFMQPIFGIASVLVVFVFIPLGLFRGTRMFAAVALMISSVIFGITTWLFSAAVTFGLLGWFWLVIGLFMAGVGVAPLGIIAALLNGYGSAAFGIVFGLFLTIGSRVLANHWGEKAEMEKAA